MIMISGFSFTYLLGPSKDNRYFLCGALNASKATSRRNRQPTCSAPDHGLGMAGPIYSVGVVRSISFWKCHRAPTVWIPELTQGCRYSLALGSKPPLINRDIFSSIPSGLRRKNQKVFFMRSRPRLIDWRIDSSCTPSASAISLIDLPRMIYASILRPWISGRELRASTDEERFPSVQEAPAGSAHAGRRNIQSRHRSPENTAPCAGRAAAGRPFRSGHRP